MYLIIRIAILSMPDHAAQAAAAQQAAHHRVPLADNNKVLAMPAEIVNIVKAWHGKRNVACMCKTCAHIDLRLAHAGRLWVPRQQVVQVGHVENPEA